MKSIKNYKNFKAEQFITNLQTTDWDKPLEIKNKLKVL